MKLQEKSLAVIMRAGVLALLAVGVPKLFFVLQSHASEEVRFHRGIHHAVPCLQMPEKQEAPSVSSEKTVALVTNQTRPECGSAITLDRLVARGFSVRKLLIPFAYQKDAVLKYLLSQPFFSRSVDVYTGPAGMLFSANNLAGCDALVLDLQDTGIRTDGYVEVVYAALCAARNFAKELIIIDHPNPLGGTIEGIGLSEERVSDETLFLARIPLRHGMTLGELACYMNRSLLSSPAELTVIPLSTYNRFTPVDVRTLRMPFSQNIASLEACRCYSFLGVLGEIAPFDVGIGTRYAFQALLVPEKYGISRAAWEQYREILKRFSITTRLWRYYSPRKKQWLSGVRMHIPGNTAFSSTQILATTLSFFKKLGLTLSLSSRLDALVGSSLVHALVKNQKSKELLLPAVKEVDKKFLKEAFSSCLYKPLPRRSLL